MDRVGAQGQRADVPIVLAKAAIQREPLDVQDLVDGVPDDVVEGFIGINSVHVSDIEIRPTGKVSQRDREAQLRRDDILVRRATRARCPSAPSKGGEGHLELLNESVELFLIEPVAACKRVARALSTPSERGLPCSPIHALSLEVRTLLGPSRRSLDVLAEHDERRFVLTL